MIDHTSKELQKVKFDICVIGLGYVGLPTALLFARSGLRVLGVDVDNSKVAGLANEGFKFEELELEELLWTVQKNHHFEARLGVSPSHAFIICVPTPIDSFNKPDLSFVLQAIEQIASVVEDGDLVILESTSPPGTTQLISEILTYLLC